MKAFYERNRLFEVFDKKKVPSIRFLGYSIMSKGSEAQFSKIIVSTQKRTDVLILHVLMNHTLDRYSTLVNLMALCHPDKAFLI